MKELLKIFLIFAKVGVVTFGGGYAMLPILQREVVTRGYATDEELMDYYAIGQCTPGIIAVNVATFVGYKRNGILGGIIATLGVVFPSVVIISIIAAFITNFSEIVIFQYALSGIRICVCVLIFNAVLKLSKASLTDKWSYIIFLIVFALSFIFDVSSALLVIIAGVLGYLIKKFLKEGKTNAVD